MQIIENLNLRRSKYRQHPESEYIGNTFYGRMTIGARKQCATLDEHQRFPSIRFEALRNHRQGEFATDTSSP